MVTICTKKFCQPTIQERISSKRKKKDEVNGLKSSFDDFFKRLNTKREQTNLKVLSGTSIPNSTFRSISADLSNKEDKSGLSQNNKSNSSINSKQNLNPSLRSLKRDNEKSQESSLLLVKSNEHKRNSESILLETSTLEELKDMRNLLYKSSYVPKQTTSRRPTIEKIRSAIQKEKQTLKDNAENATSEFVVLSDASTSTERKKKKKLKRKKKIAEPTKDTNNSVKSIGIINNNINNRKKKTTEKSRKKKTIEKINVEIQCSIHIDEM